MYYLILILLSYMIILLHKRLPQKDMSYYHTFEKAGSTHYYEIDLLVSSSTANILTVLNKIVEIVPNDEKSG